MKLSRRGLLGVAAGATGVGLVRRQLAHADQKAAPSRLAQYDETQVATICQQCPGGCGLFARVVDGEIVGVAGNPYHPVNRGGLCPKAFASLQLLQAPHRVRGPMIRDGERGKLKPASWDEALKLVGERLADLRGKGLAHTVAIVGGQYRGTRDALFRQFAQAYGTPNYLRTRSLTPELAAESHKRMHGATSPFAYDIGNARIVVSFGAGLLESWHNPVHASRAIARLRGTDERRRGKLIQIDPRRSATAIKADRWVNLVPGTDGILALGLANVLVREGLYDSTWVDENTTGFEQFRDLVLGDYGLMAVSAATGVPVNTILEVARDLGTIRPALVIGERGPSFGPEDLRTRMAIHSLNALTGSIGARGGVVPQAPLPLSPLPAPIENAAARASLAQRRIEPRSLAAEILAGTPVNALLLFQTNPLATARDKEQFEKAIEKVPLLVSFSPFLDETASRADVVLPDSLFFERWQDDSVTHLAGVSSYSVARPATAPRYSTRDTADVLLDLAARAGVGPSLPWKSFEEVLRVVSRGLYEAKRGYVVAGPADESLRVTMERQGYWLPEFTSFDKFFDALAKRGAWSDESSLPPGRKATFASGKFDFSAGTLAVKLPGAPQESAYPLRLNTYRLMMSPHGGARGQAWLLEQPASHLRAAWENWIEIHPATAAPLGISDGDAVLVESATGSVKLTARLYRGTREDVVHVPLFTGMGGNPNQLGAHVRVRRA